MHPVTVRYIHDGAEPIPVCRCRAYSLTADIAFRGEDLVLTETHTPSCRRGRALTPPPPVVEDLRHDCGVKHRKASTLAGCEWPTTMHRGTGHLGLLSCPGPWSAPTADAPGVVDWFTDMAEAVEAVHEADLLGCAAGCAGTVAHRLVRLCLTDDEPEAGR